MTHPPRIPRTILKGKPKQNLRRRAQHLEFIRQLPCVVCVNHPGCAPPERSEPAHIRIGTDGGASLKPSDRYTVPLCHFHHAAQHQCGELTFWTAFRIDPLNVALRLWTVSGDQEAGERIVFRARQQINLVKAP